MKKQYAKSHTWIDDPTLPRPLAWLRGSGKGRAELESRWAAHARGPVAWWKDYRLPILTGLWDTVNIWQRIFRYPLGKRSAITTVKGYPEVAKAERLARSAESTAVERKQQRSEQLGQLLERFDGLFRYWGVRYPKGLAKGQHAFSDDIAQQGRLGFMTAWLPHCDLGYELCKSVRKTKRIAVLTKSGRIARKMQVVYSDGKAVGRWLAPIYRLKVELSPSCEKFAIIALKAGKYGALRAARLYTRNGIVETVFSSLNVPVGFTLEEYLSSLGESPLEYAGKVKITSPWVDTTLAKLDGSLDSAAIKDDLASIPTDSLNGARIARAFKTATPRDIQVLLYSLAGLSLAEMARAEGIPLPSMRQRAHRMRAAIG